MNLQRPAPKQTKPQNAVKVFSGEIFDVYQWQQQLYSGETVTFEQLKRPDSVDILPITAEGKIILTKQEQPGLEPFIGALGGRIDAGEDVLETAKRELLEEAGLRAKKLELWDAIQPFEKIDWAIWTFIAKGCERVNDQRGDAGEKIELIEVTFEEYVELVAKDNFRDSEITLKLLKLERLGELEKVKQQWLS